MLGIDVFRPLMWPAFLVCLSPLIAFSATLNDIKAIPHLDSAGQSAYREFLAAGNHRAFAIAPGGAWAWIGSEISAQSATDSALRICQNDSGLQCVAYALDDKVVFDTHTWARLWGPYLNRTESILTHIGLNRGERFYNLAFRDSSGKAITLFELQGKVVLLHFWGSWCPLCRGEMPELQRLHRTLEHSSEIQMVLLQVQEDFDISHQWMRQQHLDLPLFDSGDKSKGVGMLSLANGMKIHDRDIAPAFPTTYILDKHGVIVFSNIGPLTHWLQYLPLLRDVAARSGQ